MVGDRTSRKMYRQRVSIRKGRIAVTMLGARGAAVNNRPGDEITVSDKISYVNLQPSLNDTPRDGETTRLYDHPSSTAPGRNSINVGAPTFLRNELIFWIGPA